MLPNVYQTLRGNSTVVSTVGTRIPSWFCATECTEAIYYLVLVAGTPENVLNAAPCSDRDTIQIDCWSESDEGIETLAYAVRAALDSNLISNRMVINNRESDTKLYRIAIEADFIASR